MKTQFLIVANATGKLGRILVAIQMDGKSPAKGSDGKTIWKRLVTDLKTLAMPTGLVVDLIAGDMITVDVISTKKAVSQVDPYSIRFHSCRTFPEMAGILNPLNLTETDGFTVVRLENQAFDIESGKFTNVSSEVIDPWFLEIVHYYPESLGEKQNRITIVQDSKILSVIHENQ